MSVMKNENSSFLVSIENSLKYYLKDLLKQSPGTDYINEFLSEVKHVHKGEELNFKTMINICKRKLNQSIQNLQIFELSVDALKSIMNFNDIKNQFLNHPISEVVCFMMPEVYKLNNLSLFSSGFEKYGYFWKLKSIVAVKGIASVSIILEPGTRKYGIYYDYKSKIASETTDSFYKAILMICEEGFVPLAFFYFFSSTEPVESEKFPTGTSNKIEHYLESMRSNTSIKSKCITLKQRQELIKIDIEQNKKLFTRYIVVPKEYHEMHFSSSKKTQINANGARNRSAIPKHFTDENPAKSGGFKEYAKKSKDFELPKIVDAPKNVRNSMEVGQFKPVKCLERSNQPPPIESVSSQSPPKLNLPPKDPLLKQSPPELNLLNPRASPKKQPMQNSMMLNIPSQAPQSIDKSMIETHQLGNHEEPLPSPIPQNDRQSSASVLKTGKELATQTDDTLPFLSFDKKAQASPYNTSPPNLKNPLAKSAGYNSIHPENVRPSKKINPLTPPPINPSPNGPNPPILYNENSSSPFVPPRLPDSYSPPPPPLLVPGRVNPPNIYKEDPNSLNSPPGLGVPTNIYNPPQLIPETQKFYNIEARNLPPPQLIPEIPKVNNIEARNLSPPPQYFESDKNFETLHPPSVYAPNQTSSNLEKNPFPNIFQQLNPTEEDRYPNTGSSYYNEAYPEHPKELSETEVHNPLSENNHLPAENYDYYPANYEGGNSPDYYENQDYSPEKAQTPVYENHYYEKPNNTENHDQQYEYFNENTEEDKREDGGNNYDYQPEQLWECYECKNSNYSNSEFCYFCSLAKNNENLWLCTKCNIQNFTQYAYCLECKLAKPFYGDWYCVCGCENTKDNEYCTNCNESKNTSALTYCEKCNENIFAYRPESHHCEYI